MVEVEIRTPRHDGEHGTVEWVGRMLVRADADDLQFYVRGEQPPLYVHPDMTVIDNVTGQVISSHDDPETWTRNLPYAFRGGDVLAVVVHDDAPAAAPPRAPHREPAPTVPKAAGPVVLAA